MMDFNLLFYFLSKFCENQNNSETHLRPLEPNKLKPWEMKRADETWKTYLVNRKAYLSYLLPFHAGLPAALTLIQVHFLSQLSN